MGPPSDGERPAGHPRAGGRARRRRLLRFAVLGLVLLVVVTGVGATALYVKLERNISQIDIDGALGPDRPEDAPHDSLDILVLGSDSRAGANGAYGGEDAQEGARADTAMIVHVNEGHDAATVVSIPRDTMVERPACERADGSKAPARERSMFNEAYTVGGPVCSVKTVEEMTGLRMDHFIEIDFHGFADMIDTLGGVEVTTTQAIDDKDSHLDLPAGTHTLDGEQSLALVRTRKAVGDGSDLSRIELQQQFVRALADQVSGMGLMTNPKRLWDLADVATSAVTTDSSLGSVRDLAGLGRGMRDIGPDDLQMVTLPVTRDAADPNRVAPVEDRSRQVWHALREDRPVPRSATVDSRGEDGGGTPVAIPGRAPREE
ncbi:LCP family protein [Streptomyces radicis]|uniref:LytR family transcriptional regulator n=1 Tax=Streptomyces radicis TaxID=1750517 RepID=A0A3A9W8G4_9ACTN|nr:LCP family protein [Streptomyces radicis]RKN09388.1 LytR family transcriptional regulator [Streptomyces radicis]RKN23014.1 LytR family transcriptional regulator [Streptomyces radicis]